MIPLTLTLWKKGADFLLQYFRDLRRASFSCRVLADSLHFRLERCALSLVVTRRP